MPRPFIVQHSFTDPNLLAEIQVFSERFGTERRAQTINAVESETEARVLFQHVINLALRYGTPGSVRFHRCSHSEGGEGTDCRNDPSYMERNI